MEGHHKTELKKKNAKPAYQKIFELCPYSQVLYKHTYGNKNTFRKDLPNSIEVPQDNCKITGINCMTKDRNFSCDYYLVLLLF